MTKHGPRSQSLHACGVQSAFPASPRLCPVMSLCLWERGMSMPCPP